MNCIIKKIWCTMRKWASLAWQKLASIAWRKSASLVASRLWKTLVVHPGLGAASAQGIAAGIGFASSKIKEEFGVALFSWGFPPTQYVQTEAYAIGYGIGLVCSVFAMLFRWLQWYRNRQEQRCPDTSLPQPGHPCTERGRDNKPTCCKQDP